MYFLWLCIKRPIASFSAYSYKKLPFWATKMWFVPLCLRLQYFLNLILWIYVFWIIAKFGNLLKDQSRVFLQIPTRNGDFGYNKNLVKGVLKINKKIHRCFSLFKRTSSKDRILALCKLFVRSFFLVKGHEAKRNHKKNGNMKISWYWDLYVGEGFANSAF
jgi:hypothetical protein